MMTTVLLLLLGFQTPAPQQPPAPQPPVLEYLVGPQDKLDINVIPSVFSAPKVTVEPDGMFQYQNLGRIKANGLTQRQIADAVKQLLIDKRQHLNPTVTVEVVEFRSQTIYVQGDGVKTGGSFRLQGNDTLQSAIFQAGSFTSKAGSTVTITRKAPVTGGKPTAFEIPRRDIELNTGLAATFRLQDGDIISVPEAGHVLVQGEVKSPGAYDISEDAKMVSDFINLAGGFTPRANKGNVEITRNVNGKPTAIKVNKELTTPVQPNDVIQVKTRRF